MARDGDPKLEIAVRTGACSCVCYILFLVGLFDLIFRSPLRAQRARDWLAPAFWQDATCHVLSVGRAYRGTCSASDETDSLGNPLGDCPGVHWCANEGDTCDCPGGDVSFGPGGFWASSLQGPCAVLHQAGGPVRCGPPQPGDEQGFPDDPAPYQTKHCYCTSAGILATLAGRNPHPQSCGQRADQIYDSLDVHWYGGVDTAAEQLAVGGGVGAEDSNDNGTLAEEEDDAGLEPERLLEVSSGSRRRGCAWTYMPWALVEVAATDVFGQPLPDTDTKLRCAYEFGAPHASRDKDVGNSYEFMTGEESHWQQLQGQNLPCKVRSGTDACAVALEPLGELAKREGTMGTEAVNHLVLIFAIATCLCAVTLGLCVGNWGSSPTQHAQPLMQAVAIPFGRQPLRRQVSQVLVGRNVSTRLFGPSDFHTGDRVRLVTSRGGIPAPSEGYIAGIDGAAITYMDGDSGEAVEVEAADLVKL